MGDVLLLGFAGSQEVEHRGRPLHGEKPSHDAGQCSQPDLRKEGWFQLDLFADKEEVDADGNEDCPKDMLQELVIETCHGTYGKETHDGENAKEGEDFLPDDVLSHAVGHHQGHGAGQHSRKGGCFAVARQNVGKNGHDKDAEPESADPLDKAAHAAEG